MEHLKASKGITGKLNIDKKLRDTIKLPEAGITADKILEMESWVTPKRSTHNIPVKLPDGELINVQVHNCTTIKELSHKLQDETGMAVEEQFLEYNGKPVQQDKLPVEICGHRKMPIVLKWQSSKSKFVFE